MEVEKVPELCCVGVRRPTRNAGHANLHARRPAATRFTCYLTLAFAPYTIYRRKVFWRHVLGGEIVVITGRNWWK